MYYGKLRKKLFKKIFQELSTKYSAQKHNFTRKQRRYIGLHQN